MKFFKYIKYIPVVLEAIEVLESIIELSKRRKEVKDSDESIRVESLLEQAADRLVDLVYDFIPQQFRANATIDEMKSFTATLDNTAVSVIETVEAGIPLFSGGENKDIVA